MAATIVVPAEVAGELRDALSFYLSDLTERAVPAHDEDAEGLREMIEETDSLMGQLGREPYPEKEYTLRVEHPGLLRGLVCGEIESAIADLEESDSPGSYEAIRRLRWGAKVFEAMEEAA